MPEKKEKKQTILDKVEQVNKILESQEPESITRDEDAGYMGYKPQYIVDAMNKVFGIGVWGFELVSQDKVEVKTRAGTGLLMIASVKAWIQGIEFHPQATGQNRVTRGDEGDAAKGAQTDALKKALSYFSVGSRAYRGELPVVQQGKGKQSPASPYDDAMSVIENCANKETMSSWRKKINGSHIYTMDQKQKLNNAITKRIEKIEGAK